MIVGSFHDQALIGKPPPASHGILNYASWADFTVVQGTTDLEGDRIGLPDVTKNPYRGNGQYMHLVNRSGTTTIVRTTASFVAHIQYFYVIVFNMSLQEPYARGSYQAGFFLGSPFWTMGAAASNAQPASWNELIYYGGSDLGYHLSSQSLAYGQTELSGTYYVWFRLTTSPGDGYGPYIKSIQVGERDNLGHALTVLDAEVGVEG